MKHLRLATFALVHNWTALLRDPPRDAKEPDNAHGWPTVVRWKACGFVVLCSSIRDFRLHSRREVVSKRAVG